MSDKDSGSKSKQGAGRMVRDVVLVAVILGGGFYWYLHRTENSKAANKVAAEAKLLLLKDNPADYAAAEAKLKEVIEKYDSSHGYSLAALAETDAILWGENHVAAKQADAKAKTAAAMKANPGIAEQYSAEALVQTFDGKASQAETFLTKDVLEKGGGGARIYAALGQAQRAQGKLDDARRAFKAAFDADWRNPRFAQLIGESYLEEGDALNALAYFQKGLTANSEHFGSQLGSARARLMRGEQIKEATEAIERAVAATDLTPALKARALTAQAELRLFEQKVDQAIASATKAAEVDPSFAWAFAAKARAEARKNPGAAAASFDKAIEADRYVAAFYFDAAEALIASGDAAKATSYLEKFPLKKDDRYFLKYGAVFAAAGQLDKAIAKFDEAIKANETNADAYLAKGSALVAQKKLDEAQKVLEIAVRAREFNPPVYVQLANIRFEKKEWEEGMQQYATALTQWRNSKAPREQLTGAIQEVKQLLLKNGQKKYADVWESEATQLVR
ncbi:tetratricopeptide repeat protein [Vulgatibacter incomptus]|uniref:TPR domain protein, putative component of TonB system n=1 Tax=Vulgatibacter incomptus TaxID=1391653 RepID=A0A0K1PD41_9BACT|nr:tetratricopeptide repeat protein [Vulgatibacter incomptus]AKU91316.1 TPR domain protein, putative component of TonB system [Vulgatibacter incomptus]